MVRGIQIPYKYPPLYSHGCAEYRIDVRLSLEMTVIPNRN